MKILGVHHNHDGNVAFLEDGRLIFSREAEKDSGPRHAGLSPEDFFAALERLTTWPDVLAIAGWHKFYGGYYGLRRPEVKKRVLCGKTVLMCSMSHERAHVLSTFAMSPFAQGSPCYVLLWEGIIGAFYKIDADLNIIEIGRPLSHPGYRYSYGYFLGNPSCRSKRYWETLDMAGKMMALAAYPRTTSLPAGDANLIKRILTPAARLPESKTVTGNEEIFTLLTGEKSVVGPLSEIVDGGLENPRFQRFAAGLSDSLYDVFHAFAKKHLPEQLPLVIGGGCGLNCEWNSRLRDSGVFNGVFVPPCPNDSGISIGAAADAQVALTGSAKISWNVYCGDEFVSDIEAPDAWVEEVMNFGRVADLLMDNRVIAWVQGRYEMGPRALGNRSLLAAPFLATMTQRLNQMKEREGYRPIAPVCLEADMHHHFHPPFSSPYMLHFQRVLSSELKAVTHTDGSARAQTVNDAQNPRLCALLRAFKEKSGFGVLCNTSLNYKGRGFVNKKGDLFDLAGKIGIDGIVINDMLYTKRA